MDENDTNENETLENETVETTEDQSTDTTDRSIIEDTSEELSEDKKRGIAKRNLKKMRNEFPELFEDTKDKEEKASGDKVAPTSETLSREEQLLAIEMSKKDIPLEGLDTAQKIAKRDGISVTEAYRSDEFEVWVETHNRKEQAKASQLSASTGGKNRKTKDFNTPGLAADEHKALFNRAMG